MVSISERIWRTATKSYLRPFTAFAGISHRGKSRRLQRVLADFGAEHSFARAGAHLQEHYGFSLGASAAREATLLHAKRARAIEQARSEQSFRILPKEGARQLIAQADGSMICTVEAGKGRAEKRPREWKEMRLVAAQVHGSASALYGAGFSTVEDTGRRWGHCAREAGWGLDSKIHVLGDGADWVRLQSQEVFGTQGRFLVDFYHVSEYLAAAAATIVPADRVAGWLRVQQKRLKRGARDKVLAALEPFEEPPQASEEQAPVRAALRYLRARIEWLDYPAAIERELPIGSGLIESGHKHVLQARLKKGGTAWLAANADAMAQLRVLRANHQWEDLWQPSKAA